MLPLLAWSWGALVRLGALLLSQSYELIHVAFITVASLTFALYEALSHFPDEVQHIWRYIHPSMFYSSEHVAQIHIHSPANQIHHTLNGYISPCDIFPYCSKCKQFKYEDLMIYRVLELILWLLQRSTRRWCHNPPTQLSRLVWFRGCIRADHHCWS
jgi:hypothetical protein